jgi:phosphoribosylcarboxyaminoimidazole (NCAIR) mutase
MRRDIVRIHAVLIAGAGGSRQLAATVAAIGALAVVLLPAIGVVLAMSPTP